MDVYKSIDRELERQGKSRRKLALDAKIPPSTFQSMIERKRGMSIETLQKLADALHVFWLDLYPEEQRESIAWEATRTGKFNPYLPKYETVSFDRGLQMGLVSLPIEWGPRKRAEYYFNLLNDCGQDVAIQTAKSRISAIQKDKASEFAF